MPYNILIRIGNILLTAFVLAASICTSKAEQGTPSNDTVSPSQTGAKDPGSLDVILVNPKHPATPNPTPDKDGEQAFKLASYVIKIRSHLEMVGILNFPKKDGKNMQGELILLIPIFQDGFIYEKEGGPQIKQASGNPALDSAAIAIVRRAAPFDHIPKELRTKDNDDVFELIMRLKFSSDGIMTATYLSKVN